MRAIEKHRNSGDVLRRRATYPLYLGAGHQTNGDSLGGSSPGQGENLGPEMPSQCYMPLDATPPRQAPATCIAATP